MRAILRAPSSFWSRSQSRFDILFSYFSSSPSPSSQSPSSQSPSSPSPSTMKDEYVETDVIELNYTSPTPLTLESTLLLESPSITYNTYGTLCPYTRSNVIVVCHALTGNTLLESWWGDMVGPGKPLDTTDHFVVSVGLLGTVNGNTTGPTSQIPNTPNNERYGKNFPDLSIRDSVNLQVQMLKEHLNVKSVKTVIGGSFGGMQALEYMCTHGTSEESANSNFVRSGIPIACGVRHSAWQIGISETQRQAIYNDQKWSDPYDFNDPPQSGLEVARQIAMVSYRTAMGFQHKFGRKKTTHFERAQYGSETKWDVKSYLEYQGKKFTTRFDPLSYVKLTEVMDSHDVGRGRGGAAAALGAVKIPSLVLGISR